MNAFGAGKTVRGRGFTLVELLIVIIIIAVLAAIAIPKFADSQLRAKESSLRHDLQIYREAVGRFKSDTGLYPLQLDDLTLSTPPAKGVSADGSQVALTAAEFHGPYMDRIEDDPIADAAFTYGGTTKPGDVRSSAPGNALDGSLYSAW